MILILLVMSSLMQTEPSPTTGPLDHLRERLDRRRRVIASEMDGARAIHPREPFAYRILLLGEMYELGQAEEREHRMVGCRAALVADLIVCLGEKARWIADEAVACGAKRENVYHVMTRERCLDLVRRLVTRKSVVLFKGSRGLEMENIVNQFVVRRDE